MAQRRASSVSRDEREERAERRAAFVEAETAAARAAAAATAAREAAKRVQLLPAAALLAGTDGDAVVTSANVRVASGTTPRAAGDDLDDDGPAVNVPNLTTDGDSGGTGSGGQGDTPAPTDTGTHDVSGTAPGAPPVTPIAPPPPSLATPASPTAPTIVYRESKREKKLRIPKFKGLDEPKLTVKAWLKAVKNELRRQAAILRTEWREHEVFIEMVASLEGEALLWYDTVEDLLANREDQTFGNLSRLMKDRYMVKRSNPEVVARLRMRRQQRGEPLVEYAQKLREIASNNPVDEEWLVDAFLAGMSNPWNATLVRGHRPVTLNAAVNAALDQVGEFGEGYGIGLGASIMQHDGRVAAAAAGNAPVLGTNLTPIQYASGGTLGQVVSGYDGFGLASGPPPRYDTDGRLVVPRGNAASAIPGGAQWGAVIPTGYQLVPVEVGKQRDGATIASSGFQAFEAQPVQRAVRPTVHTTPQSQRSDGNNKSGRRSGRAMKLEEQPKEHERQAARSGSYNNTAPLPTKEARLLNLRRRLQESRSQKKRSASYSKDDDMCYYCHELGHHSHECELKKADLADDSPVVDQNAEANNRGNGGSGNAQRA